MKKTILVVLCSLFASVAFAQEKSDAYLEVVSIMKEKLNYNHDSANNQSKLSKPDTVVVKETPVAGNRIRYSSSTMIYDNSPLVVLNGISVEMDELNKYKVKEIENTEVLQGARATALYGSRGANGVILISTKKKK